MPAPALSLADLDTELTTIRGAILNAMGAPGVDLLDALTLTEAAIKGLQGRLGQTVTDPVANIQALCKQIETRARHVWPDYARAYFTVVADRFSFHAFTLGGGAVEGHGATIADACADIMGKLAELDPRLLARTLDVDGTVLPEARDETEVACPGCKGTGQGHGDSDVCNGCGGDGVVPAWSVRARPAKTEAR